MMQSCTTSAICLVLMAQAMAAGPAATSRQAASALPPDIKSGLDALTAAMRNTAQRQEALGRLELIQSAYCAALQDLKDDRDAEVRARTGQLQDTLVMDLRLLRAANFLPGPQRQAIQSAARAAPALFYSWFSPQSQALPFWEVAGATLSKAQLEAVLLLSLHSNDPGVQAAAIRFLSDNELNNDLLSPLVADLAAEGFNTPQMPGRYFGVVDLSSILGILEMSRSPSVAAKLMAMYLAPSSFVPDARLPIAKAAANTGQLGIIPVMLDRLKNTKSVPFAFMANKLSIAPSDAALAVLIAATGQKPEDYGVMEGSLGSFGTCAGFKDDESRTAAIKRFTDWWDKHKDQPPYKDLKPLEIPKFPPPRVERWDY